MKTFKQMISEVARAVSPADKEFVALHKIEKKQFTKNPEHQFKGGTKKDHTKLADQSNDTGMVDDVKTQHPAGSTDDLDEARFDHRAAAEHGIVHFDTAKQHAALKKGTEVDFYKPDTSKTSGIVHAYDGKTITYKEHGKDGKIGTGAIHKFKTGHSYPGLNEEIELQEISKKTLGNYIDSASHDMAGHRADFEKHNMSPHDAFTRANDKRNVDLDASSAKKHYDKMWKRSDGINKALDRLTKEEVDGMSFDQLAEMNLQEISKATLGSYIKKAANATAINAYLAGGASDAAKDAKEKMRKKSISRINGISKAADRLTKEEVEQIDEISKETLGSYIKKATSDVGARMYGAGMSSVAAVHAGHRTVQGANLNAGSVKSATKANKRKAGIDKATDKLTKEEVEQIDEISKETLGSYIKKATQDHGTSKRYQVISAKRAHETGEKADQDFANEEGNRARKRLRGVGKAVDKLTKQ
jgi:hypothetical protein